MVPGMRVECKWCGVPAGKGCGHGCETLLAGCFQVFLEREKDKK